MVAPSSLLNYSCLASTQRLINLEIEKEAPITLLWLFMMGLRLMNEIAENAVMVKVLSST